MKDIFVIGSGGFSKQVIEIIEEINYKENRYNLVGIIDDNKKLVGTKVLGYKVIGDTDYLNKYSTDNKVYGIIAIANSKVRETIAKKLARVFWVNLVHPTAIVSRYTQYGVGNIICAGVIVNPNFKMGNHCHINIGCTLGHDIIIRNFVTLMPACKISGNTILKSMSTVGSGAVILQGLTLEENVILGAAALLTKNTHKDYTYIGIPARGMKKL